MLPAPCLKIPVPVSEEKEYVGEPAEPLQNCNGQVTEPPLPAAP